MGALRVRTRRWTRHEYDRLIEVGLLQEDDPIELVEGRLVVAEPQHDPHARAVELGTDALRLAFGPGWRVRVQLPLALGRDSAPEPDVVVLCGTPRDAPAGHPPTADLVVEIAESSLALDRGPKARIYARAGIADYWIVNLVDRRLEVHREPGPDARGRIKYRTVQVVRPGETLTPLAAPAASVPVDNLLP